MIQLKEFASDVISDIITKFHPVWLRMSGHCLESVSERILVGWQEGKAHLWNKKYSGSGCIRKQLSL